MRPWLGSLTAGLVGLAAVGGAAAQAPPAVVRPGAPEHPEFPRRLERQDGSPGEGPGGATETAPVPPPPSVPPALPEALPEPVVTITVGPRHACAVPHSKGLARADGGRIAVTQPAPNALAFVMTGTTAANSYLGCTGAATERFELVQEFEVARSDGPGRPVVLRLESGLVGFVRSRYKAGACVRQAEVSVAPLGCPGPPLALAHPPLCASGTQGRLCNQHLPPLESPPLPAGRYVLTARFVIDASASGICDAHAVADFAPGTTLPDEWVRRRDPFQTAPKDDFGFSAALAAAPAPLARPAFSAAPADPQTRRVAARPGGPATPGGAQPREDRGARTAPR